MSWIVAVGLEHAGVVLDERSEERRVSGLERDFAAAERARDDHVGLARVQHRLRRHHLDDAIGSAMRSALLELLGLGQHLLDAADVEERLLGHFVEFAVDDGLELLDRLLNRHVLAGEAGEDLGHEERLRQEALRPCGPG